MKHLILIAFFAFSTMTAPFMAEAADEAAAETSAATEESAVSTEKKASFKEQISSLNRLKPLQNPQNQRAAEVLSYRIIDRENKIIGQVEDIVLNKDGAVDQLVVDLDRLRVKEPVSLGYQEFNFKKSSNGYQLSMSKDEIMAQSDQLLAKIETAAGEDVSGIHLKEVLGKPVLNDRNRKIGDISEVLFDTEGKQVQAFLLKVKYRSAKNDIAVPFSAIVFDRKDGNLRATMGREDVKELLIFADK